MTKKNNHSILKVALFASALGFLGLFGADLYLPAMPSMQVAFHARTSDIELSVAIYMIGLGLGTLVFGPIADCIGRKRTVIAGLMLAILSAAIAAGTQHIQSFLICRTVQGFGAGATMGIFRVMLRDVVHGKRMASLASYTTMMLNLSPVLGMLLGGYLVHYFNWRMCFVAMVVAYGVFIPIYARFCPETLQHPSELKLSMIAERYWHAFSDMRLVGMALCSGLGFSAAFGFATAGPFIYQHDFHISAVAFGWLGGLLSLATIAGKFTNARLSKRLALPRLMLLGMAIIFMAGVSLFIIPLNVVSLTVVICVVAASIGLILSNAMSLAMQHYTRHIGYAAATYSFIQLITVFITNSVLAHGYHFGIVALSIFYLVLALCSITLLTLTRRHHYAQKKEKELIGQNA